MIETAGTRGTATGRAARLTWGASLAAGLCLALIVSARAAPAPNQVIGYAAADRTGATATWTLGANQPYLLLPTVGGTVAAGIAAVEAGAELGVALFQRPYFVGHDVGCVPELGSDERPDLKWRGATARFSPPVDANGDVEQPAERYASLIIYRKDLGPPPGVLLLDRRLTLVSNCSRAAHRTLFDRVFIPAAAPPETTRCFNLEGSYPRDGGADVKFKFLRADRLALLTPADLDDRYRSVQHRFSVIAYDGEGCRGGGAEFRGGAGGARDYRLDQVGLRDRVRSVRIVYEGGPLTPYMVAPVAAPVAPPAAVPKVADAAPVPPPTATATAAVPATATDAAAPVGADTQAAANPAAAETPPIASVRVLPSQPAPEPTAAPAPVPLQLAMPAPRLKVPAPAPAVAASPTSQTFDYPVHEIYRLNFCLRWGLDCGEPAATAWCRAKGFAKADTWTIDKNIGALFPTIVMADKRVCAQFPCDGFQQITCTK